MGKALFITFEGIDGSGKSTAAEKLCAYLEERGRKVQYTYEPGGCAWSKTMRNLLLHGAYAPHPRTEALLFAADRAEHMARIILPALERGEIVVCDRFADSTLAYQGGGRGMDEAELEALSDFASAGRKPDLTFYLALPVQTALARRIGGLDRMEREEEGFYLRVAAAYERLAEEAPERIVKIDASLDEQAVWRQIREKMESLLQMPFAAGGKAEPGKL